MTVATGMCFQQEAWKQIKNLDTENEALDNFAKPISYEV